jgi:hypothetical protein
MKNIDAWLREEAEEIKKEADKIEKKIIQEANRGNFDKINELNIRKRELNAQEYKLYQMVGKLNDFKITL